MDINIVNPGFLYNFELCNLAEAALGPLLKLFQLIKVSFFLQTLICSLQPKLNWCHVNMARNCTVTCIKLVYFHVSHCVEIAFKADKCHQMLMLRTTLAAPLPTRGGSAQSAARQNLRVGVRKHLSNQAIDTIILIYTIWML